MGDFIYLLIFMKEAKFSKLQPKFPSVFKIDFVYTFSGCHLSQLNMKNSFIVMRESGDQVRSFETIDDSSLQSPHIYTVDLLYRYVYYKDLLYSKQSNFLRRLAVLKTIKVVLLQMKANPWKFNKY